MDAFEVLMEEHGVILVAIDILKQSTIKEMPTGFYIKILDIIRDFADRCHHGKEEIALFPLIKQKEMSQSENLYILLGEHEKARSLIAAIRQAIDNNDSQSKIRNIKDYFQLLTRHISKENELFVSWFKLLNNYDKDLLFKEFEKIEEKVIGIGKHEEYLINLKNMKSQIQQSEAM